MKYTRFNLISLFASVNMAATIQEPAIDLEIYNISSISIKWDGTPIGNLVLQGSNAANTDSDFLSSFDTIPNSRVAVSGAGLQTWNFLQPLGFKWFRILWTFSSGTGTILSCNCTVRA